jgi:hypothetical protein
MHPRGVRITGRGRVEEAMAVRIRKLAREVERNPADVIGVLHALGFTKYRSPDDMLTPEVEAKLRRGLQKGVRPIEVPGVGAASTRPAEVVEAVGGADLMASLVPGVVPVGGRARPVARVEVAPVASADAAPRGAVARAPAVAAVVPPRPAARPMEVDPAEAAVLATERAALDSLRRSLASERGVVEAERAQLEVDAARLAARERSLAAQQESLRELQAMLERERASLDAERASLDALRSRSAAQLGVGLEDLLEARGLRGMDEYERAIVVLAQQRSLRDVLWTLRADAPDQLRRILDERLVLVSGGAPEAATRGAAAVAVAPERAEVPDAATHDRMLARLGESLLLSGWRRLLVVGGRPRWQRLLRHGLDARIEVRVVPEGARGAEAASDDVRWADVVVLWDARVGEAAERVYAAGRSTLLRVEGGTWTTFLQRLGDEVARGQG